MTLAAFASICIDIVALAVLVGALYIPRHGRRDLVAAYIGVNVGVLAVTLLLSNAQGLGAGLGLGLFGVLSIIRLRSTALAQGEVAYFFAALAIGLIGSMTAGLGLTTILMALVLAALFVGDHPKLMRRNRNQVITLDRAISDEDELAGLLGQLLGAKVLNLDVQRLDLVNDTTVVDVRYQLYRPLPQAEVQQHDQVQTSSSQGGPAPAPPQESRTAFAQEGLAAAPPRESRTAFSQDGIATQTHELAATPPPGHSERRTQWRRQEQPDQQGPPATQQNPPATQQVQPTTQQNPPASRTQASRTSPPSYPRSR